MGQVVTGVFRGLLVGTASGILSQSGLAMVITRTPESALPGVLANRWVQGIVVAGAVGESLANAFISSLPARTDPIPRSGRILMGALAGGLVAGKGDRERLLGIVAGGTMAPVSAWASTTSRANLSPVVPDRMIAAGETVVAFGLAWLATK